MNPSGFLRVAARALVAAAVRPLARGAGHTGDVTKQGPDFGNTKSKAFFGRTTGGTHLYVFNDSPATPAPAGGAWSAEKIFYDAGSKNSYAALIEAAPGGFRAVWDGGTKDRSRTHSHFGKFRVSDQP